MTHRTALWWGTVEGAGLEELVRVAAQAGFDDISITPAMYFAARAEGRSDRDIQVMLADQGVAIAIIDPLLRGLPGSVGPDRVGRRFRSTFEHDETDCYRAAEAVGARGINVAHFLGEPASIASLADHIGGIAERAAARGLDVLVEFMPEGSIPDLAGAMAIVAAVDASNCGLTVDTWHHWRCGGDVEQLRAVPSARVFALQVSDALDDVRGSGGDPPTRDRLLPGEGLMPLVDLVAAARDNNPHVRIGLEVFSAALAELPPQERAQRAKQTLDELLDAVNRR